MSKQYGIKTVGGYVYPSIADYAGAKSVVDEAAGDILVARDVTEWEPVTSEPLPENVGSVIRAKIFDSDTFTHFALDTDGSWVGLNGDGDFQTAASWGFKDVEVVFVP